jgi:phosphoglycolate phosphatase
MIQGILFDKDGTLFDFHATWGVWAARLLLDLAAGDPRRAADLGRRVGFDTLSGAFRPDSPVIAGTPPQIADELLPGLPGQDRAALIERMVEAARHAPQVEAVPLVPLLAELLARGLRLGLATNDAETLAQAHLVAAGVRGAFDFVAGYDSGFGAKPDPGMPLAFARKLRLHPGAVVMVGDSRHDLEAGRAAGMRTVAVLTGPAPEAALADLADAVLPDIGALPAWLDGRRHGLRGRRPG